MPRSKYTKTPGPLPPIERISREAFRFDDQSRRELICLLPLELQQLPVPENIEQEVPELPGASQHETLAKLIVAWTEHQIQSYLTTRRLGIGRSANPANVAAAIRKLRAALKPFVEGWVDYETAAWAHVLSYFSVVNHFESFARGVLDSKDLIFYATVIFLGLFFTARSMESLRWRS